MSQTQLHGSNAERQKAYRQRKEQAVRDQLRAKALPPLPPINAMPGQSRWRALLQSAQWSLSTAQREMEDYFEDRSQTWQEGERGEAFQEKIDALSELCEALDQQLCQD